MRQSGPLIQYDWCPHKKRAIWTQTHTERDIWRQRHIGRWPHCHKPRNTWATRCRKNQERNFPQKASVKHGFADTLFWTSSLPSCERMNFYCFKPPSSWYLVMAALGNECSDFIQFQAYYFWSTAKGMTRGGEVGGRREPLCLAESWNQGRVTLVSFLILQLPGSIYVEMKTVLHCVPSKTQSTSRQEVGST